MNPTDQIASEAWDKAYAAHNEQPSYGRAAAIAIIKAAIASGVAEQKIANRAAHASEQVAVETQCESGGNYGLCKAHPTCELIRQRVETYEKALREIAGMSWHQVGKAALYIAEAALSQRPTPATNK